MTTSSPVRSSRWFWNSLGYQVRDVGDVASALIAVESFQPSVVVTDWNLPDGNGGGLARQLRQQSRDLPIIWFPAMPPI